MNDSRLVFGTGKSEDERDWELHPTRNQAVYRHVKDSKFDPQIDLYDKLNAALESSVDVKISWDGLRRMWVIERVADINNETVDIAIKPFVDRIEELENLAISMYNQCKMCPERKHSPCVSPFKHDINKLLCIKAERQALHNAIEKQGDHNE